METIRLKGGISQGFSMVAATADLKTKDVIQIKIAKASKSAAVVRLTKALRSTGYGITLRLTAASFHRISGWEGPIAEASGGTPS
jgi:hypothetical protein